MYNFGTAPYGNHPPPGYQGGYPGSAGLPPMGAPPPMSAPGVGPAPGMEQANAQQPNRPGGFPPNFQHPQNMPNINFSAPVIRLGTGSGAKPGPGGDGGRGDQRGGRMGLGASDAQRSAPVSLIPPSKDEVVRTIFVGGITEGAGGDDGIERILRSAGNLRRWTRAMDSDHKPCRFGFAEYDDPDSLATAVDVLKDVEVPVKPQSSDKDEAAKMEPVEKSALTIIIDEDTLDYIEQAQAARGDEDPAQKQARLDASKSNLAAVLADLTNPSTPVQQSDMSKVDNDGDTSMDNGGANGEAEVVTIPLTADDELADIPAEMRETVAKEIASFRERSNRRDLERLKREEEVEAMDRRHGGARSKPSRLDSPPPSARDGTNGIPVGPRERGGAAGSKGPKGVSFVNGTGLHGAAGGWITREDDESDASDDELEKRRKAKRDAEEGKVFLDQERKWLNRERSRTAALERERKRDKEAEAKLGSTKEAAAKKYAELDDDAEAKRAADEYYADRSQWIRNRTAFRSRESNLDDIDRAAEERDRIREQQKRNEAMGRADDFLNRQALELDQKAREAPREPQRFKLSLGAAAQQKAQQAAASSTRRTAAEVEGLLEDEEDDGATTKRTLVPIKFDSAAEAAGLTDEERTQAVRQLAQEIPSDKDGLWAWQVKWDFVDDAVISDQLRPFVEKKIVEYLGVQEQMLVEAVDEHVRQRGSPSDLVELLEGALDEEAEVLVKKLWRMIIFFSESEKRGLSG